MSFGGQSYGQGFFTPEDVATEQGLRRRQAYAQALMQGDTPQGAYGGLAAAGNKILGAFLSKQADTKEANLAKSAQESYAKNFQQWLGGGNSPTPPVSVSNAVGSGPQMNAPQVPGGDASGMEGPSPAPTPIPNATGPTPMPQAIPTAQGQAPAPTPMQAPQGGQQGPTLQSLMATGDARLIQQFAPQMFTQDMARGENDRLYNRTRGDLVHDKTMRQLTADEVKARGLQGNWEVDAFNNLHQIEKPDVLSQEAFDQKLRLAREGRSNMGGLGGSSVFSTIDTPNGMYALDRMGNAKPLSGPDGKPLVSYHSDVPLRFQMGAAGAGGKAAGAVAEALPTTEAAFTQINRSLNAFDDPKLKAQADRSLGFIDSKMPTVAGYNAEFVNQLKQIEGQGFLQAFNALRGAGQITEVEGEKATNSQARMANARSAEEFYKARDDARVVFREIQNAIRQRAARGAVVPQMGGGQSQQSVPQQSRVLRFEDMK